MRKFVSRMLLLVVPLLFLSANYLGYQKSGGDLNRIGKVSVDHDYRKVFSSIMASGRLYTELSQLRGSGDVTVDVLAVGDSFSQQGAGGYQNFLTSEHGLSVLNIDSANYHLDNPLQVVSTISNASFVSSIRPRVIVLESIERRFSLRAARLDRNESLDLAGFKARYGRPEPIDESEPPLDLGLFPDMTKYFLFGVFRRLSPNAFFSQVYDVRLRKELFTTRPDRLLFFHEDVDNAHFGAEGYVAVLNDELNRIGKRLAALGITLVVLPSPDKYDMYRSFIVDGGLPENRFFDSMRVLEKNYQYVDTKSLLEPYLEGGIKDLYYADDTHWSPLASSIVAGEIASRVRALP